MHHSPIKTNSPLSLPPSVHALRRTRSDDALDRRATEDAYLDGLPSALTPATREAPLLLQLVPASKDLAAATRAFSRVAASPPHLEELTHVLEGLHQEVRTHGAWLAQFPEAERPLAQIAAGALNLYDEARIKEACAQLHPKIAAAVPAGNKIVYSYMHHAKSGALVSYSYRHANLTPDRDFDRAPYAAGDAAGPPRTLVFLDDYVGSGFQFLLALSELQAQGPLPFDQLICAALVANPVAQEHLQAASEGNDEALSQGGRKYMGSEKSGRSLADAVCGANLGKVTLVANEMETSLHAHISQTHGAAKADEVAAFLAKHRHPTLRFGDLGRTVFEHNCPNTVPHIFWDAGVRDGQRSVPWKVLLERVHDCSMYPSGRGKPADEVIFRNG